jgi:type I restriction-modification system DNA methylase subunit
MPHATEDTINDIMASYLRGKGFKVTTQISAQLYSGNKKPDFELSNGKLLYGEGEWNGTYLKGMTQAIEYGDISGASGYFLIGYPESLRRKISSKQLQLLNPEKVFGDTEFRGLLKLKDTPSSIFKGKIEDLSKWIEEALSKSIKKDPDEYVRIMHDIVQELSTYIEEEPVHFQSLFENVVSSVAGKEGKKSAARKAAAYLLLNQIVFYHVMSKEGHVPEIDEKKLRVPTQLFTEYFRPVTDAINYHAIFDFDVASLFPKKANQFIVDLVRNIKALEPEDFTRNLLGSIFHKLIPQEIRKPLAAYYTNPAAASLLANIAITEPSSKVADLACGSGTLLVAAYNKKAELSQGQTTENIHKRFIEKDLTGIDVMPFAAHLAVVQLALKNPGYMTDKVRIGVWDSTLLNPKSIIDPIHSMMPIGQRKMADYQEENLIKIRKKQGAISGKGSGTLFSMGKFDVVLMNPPFSRKQNITKELRTELAERFKDYSHYLSAEQNYNVYFTYLADRFIETSGKIAMVLPANMLKQKSSKGFREFIIGKYSVDFVIMNEFRSAFSEDTSFRDMLFIASKREQNSKQNSAIFVMLKVLPSTINCSEILEELRSFSNNQGQKVSSHLLKAVKVSQDKLKLQDDWYKLLPGEVNQEYSKESSKMVSLDKVVAKVIQGFRYEKNSEFVSTKDTLISLPREKRVRIDIKLLKVCGSHFVAQNPNSEENLIIPKNSTFPAIRTASWQKTIKIQHPMDFAIVERFDGDKEFWAESDVDQMLVRRREHIDSRKANLLMAGYGSIDLSSPGTFFIAFCSETEVAPTWSFWSLPCLKYDDAVVMALWLNSTFALSNLLKSRTEVRGTNIKWRKKDIENLPVADIGRLSEKEVKMAKSLLTELNRLDFPCLIEQLETSYKGRTKIDSFFAKILCMDATEADIIELQKNLGARLRKMQRMMTRD